MLATAGPRVWGSWIMIPSVIRRTRGIAVAEPETDGVRRDDCGRPRSTWRVVLSHHGPDGDITCVFVAILSRARELATAHQLSVAGLSELAIGLRREPDV